MDPGSYAAYSGFKDVFILDRVQRQTAAAANDDDQRGFIELLPRARDGRLTQEDWELLLKRQANSLTADEKEEFKDATRLLFSKRERSTGATGRNSGSSTNPSLVLAPSTRAPTPGGRQQTRRRGWRGTST